ncbi:zinc/manganese transport system permease protein [Brevibacterium sandarakinum]|uniref:Zinc/manganese transport system permease protein n=1 Tax=Brevibacterium sandarakinum TaxID=629680 RepID=A0A1H1TPI0_BRESA|nr:zinc ABC transporter permease AztB [Brevibacterium sandarakinum]SDS62148.1 zinc/manganese transport system permease protein [Brevibacterium sandarakinum]
MEFLFAPFEVSFVLRALIAGVLAAVLCGCIGTWVVLRGLAFFGDAMSHGMLPGVAIASILGGHLMFGAAASALVMAAGITWVSRESKLSQDVSIGLLFVGMLAVGVVIVSHSQSFAVDLTSFLFGDVLGVRAEDLVVLAIAACLGVLACVVLRRPFLALAFDERKAATLGLRPGWAHIAMLVLTAMAVVASFQVVGTILVFGLLIGPPATAYLLFVRIGAIMIAASAIGAAATFLGLLVSWHAETSAGATIALLTVLAFFAVLVAKRVKSALRYFLRNENHYQ